MKLYRVVHRGKGSDDEWKPIYTYHRGQGIYTASSTAKGVATQRSKGNNFYEYRVEVTETDWMPL